jgi:hypothetical protein
MNNIKTKLIALLLGSLAVSPITSLAFDSGSDGSYGAIMLTNATTTPITNTLALPPDGIFRCSSIYIGTNCYLNFTPNALNTPVYLLAQSNIVVAGTIDVSGSAGVTNGSIVTTPGPGGFAGGAGGTPSAGVPAGSGQGPGAGLNGNNTVPGGGSFGSIGNGGSTNYGNLLLFPLIGGSGGAGFSGLLNTYAGASGGAGGGAVLLASSTSVMVTGKIIARGGNGVGQSAIGSGFNSGGGAGGGIRIVAPTALISGILDVSGGTNSVRTTTYGGNGRVRIDTASTITANVVGNGVQAAPVTSYGRSLFVFPPAVPLLYFLNAAGTSIPAGTTNGVSISLPSGSPTNQVVTLCGTNFLGIVPVQVVATPAVGAPFVTNIVLNFVTTNELVETNVTINVPPGTATALNAFANYYVQP